MRAIIFLLLALLSLYSAMAQDFTGPEVWTNDCEYTDCYGDSSSFCLRKDGVESCSSCDDGQTGYLCEFRTYCDCTNNATCVEGEYYYKQLPWDTVFQETYHVCNCPPGFSGDRCQDVNDEKECGVLLDTEDMMFLPTCSLKTTLIKLSGCINKQLPYMLYDTGTGNFDVDTCKANVTKTKQCFWRTINDCSFTDCESIYDYGWRELYANITKVFYDPESNFTATLHKILCSPPVNGTFEFNNETFNIGGPVCGDELIDNLLVGMTMWSNHAMTLDQNQICQELDGLKKSIYGEISSSCNWSKIQEALPGLEDPPGKDGYQTKLFATAQEFFLQWNVPGCEHSTECQYTICMNEATCHREHGIEYCRCHEGFTGLFCELEYAPCDEHICQNGGICFNATGVRICDCMPGYFGKFCDVHEPSKQCPMPGDKDMVFLPTCTLKETLGNLSECINYQLPYLNPDALDPVTNCHDRITRTKHCFYRKIAGCSGTQCASAYWYGGVQLYSDISGQFYDPSSNFSMALRQVLCTLPDANGTFPYPDEPFNIGAPVCTDDIIDRLLKIMSDSGTNYPFLDPSKTCEHLEKLKMDMFNVANESCDWSKILDALPYLRNATFSKPHYWQNALQLAHLYFKEWFIPACRDSTECQYTICMNEAPCHREDGIEYCRCHEGFTGLFCELEYAPCDEHICQNGGICYNATGVRICDCMPGYFGKFCDVHEPSKQCPMPGDKDMVFLPTCTLKETLGNLSECINYQLPYLNLYAMDPVTNCHDRITRTKHCFYRKIAGCSGTQCESAYWYGGVQLYSDISGQFYDPSSNFSMALRQVLCTSPDANGTFPYPDEPFNIGAPVCTDDIIDRLLKIMSDSGTNYPFLDPSKTCEHLEKLKMDMFNVANESCDWSKILDALPYLRNATFSKPYYWQNALQLAHLYFKEWFIPECRPHPSSVCDGYCMNGGYCTLEIDGPFCACNVSWGGPRCDVHDPTHVCPAIAEGDALLLPLCPLRLTVDRSIHCFTDLAMSAFGREDYQTCELKVVAAFNCFGGFFGNCSRSRCPSIYLFPNADEVVRGMFGLFRNPAFNSMFSGYICSPPPPGGFLQILEPLLANLTINIPFCQQSFIHDLVETLGYLENGLLTNTDLAQACSVIHEFQMRLVGVMDQCDLTQLTTIFPPGWEAGLGDWIPKVLVAARSMLKTYTLPICRDGPSTGECPTITSSTPHCKFADVWMCHYFSYKKAFSQWIGKFMEWWGGCFSYDERNWDDWASSMGMNRGDGHGMGGFGMTGSHGKAGFIRMIQANMQCSDLDHEDCTGEMYTTMMGCTICYRAGRPRNPRRMFATWLQEYQQYQMAMRLVAKLREECAGTTMGCEDDFSSTMTPPTFPTTSWPDMSSTMSSTTGWPDMSSTMSSTTGWTDMSSTMSSTTGQTDMSSTTSSTTGQTDMSSTMSSTTSWPDMSSTMSSTTGQTDMSSTTSSTTGQTDMSSTTSSTTGQTDMSSTTSSTTGWTAMSSTTGLTDMSSTILSDGGSNSTTTSPGTSHGQGQDP